MIFILLYHARDFCVTGLKQICHVLSYVFGLSLVLIFLNEVLRFFKNTCLFFYFFFRLSGF